jgi:hypothetical protein
MGTYILVIKVTAIRVNRRSVVDDTEAVLEIATFPVRLPRIFGSVQL